MAFDCVLITPEQQLLTTTIVQAVVPAHDGKVGVLTGRAPMLVRLGAGALRLDTTPQQSRQFFISGGVAQMKEHTLTILANEAVPVESLTADAVAAEVSAAEALPSSTAAERDLRAKRLQLAKAKQALVR